MKTLPAPCSPTSRSRRGRPRAVVAAVLLGLSLMTPAAALAGVDPVVSDCAADGKLDKTYTAAQYAKALKSIPTDVDEYTDCRDVIRRGQLGLGGSSSSGSGGGSSTGGGTSGGGTGGTAGPATAGGAGATSSNGLNAYDTAIAGATPQERASVDKAIKGSAGGVDIGGKELRASSLGHSAGGSTNALPTPFVIVLLLLGLGALAAIAPTIRTFVRTRVQRTA